MPIIMPIKDLRNTTEISNIAHKEQEPIFITKNGYRVLPWTLVWLWRFALALWPSENHNRYK